MNIKMSINNYFKKTFFKNQLYFGLFKNLKIVQWQKVSKLYLT